MRIIHHLSTAVIYAVAANYFGHKFLLLTFEPKYRFYRIYKKHKLIHYLNTTISYAYNRSLGEERLFFYR